MRAGVGLVRRRGGVWWSARRVTGPGRGRQARCRGLCSAARPARPPLTRPGSVLMRPGDGGVDRHIPGDQALDVGAGLQLRECVGPAAVALPGTERAVAGLPGPVAVRDVAPGCPGADPPADPVDHLTAIPRRPSGRLDRRQHLFQHLPLRLRQITTSHAQPNERTRSQTRSRTALNNPGVGPGWVASGLGRSVGAGTG